MPGQRAGGEGNPEQLCHMACNLGFMVTGLVSGLFLANHSDSESFLGVHFLFGQMDAIEEDSGRWLDMWCLLLTFPELCWLVEAY